MAKDNNLQDFLTDIADAIREKKGTTEKINPQDFATEIANLSSGDDSGSGSGDKEESFGAAILALSINYNIGNTGNARDIYIDLLKMKVIPSTSNMPIVTRIEKLDTILETPFGKTNNFYDIIINVDSEQVDTFRTYGMNFCLTAGLHAVLETLVVKKDDFSNISPTSNSGYSSARIYQYNEIDVNSIYLLIGKMNSDGTFLIDAIRINSPRIDIEWKRT